MFSIFDALESLAWYLAFGFALYLRLWGDKHICKLHEEAFKHRAQMGPDDSEPEEPKALPPAAPPPPLPVWRK